jgi:hypothetical protein
MFPLKLLRFVALVMAATTGISCASRPEARPSLRWMTDATSPGNATVEARGVGSNGDASRLLRVYAGATVQADPSTPPMLGDYERNGGVLRFRPSFPLEPGVQYTAVLDLRSSPDESRMLNGVLTAAYSVPTRPEAPPTVVSHVYPGAVDLPENLLKFYVHFSAPMSRGDVYRHVRLIDDRGAEVELPFLELGEELWDPAMTRLTLYIDPGRIKRGVRPLEEIGPALVEGRRYALVIDRGMVDATGRELGQEFRKSFTVGPPDREPPDPAKWKVTPPAALSRAPLTIEFPDPMDRALAERLIRVTTADRVVPGTVSLGDAERRWTFTPDASWRAGHYEVVVQPTIEDLAGNNVGKPFEVDMQSGDEPDLKPVRLPFEVR